MNCTSTPTHSHIARKSLSKIAAPVCVCECVCVYMFVCLYLDVFLTLAAIRNDVISLQLLCVVVRVCEFLFLSPPTFVLPLLSLGLSLSLSCPCSKFPISSMFCLTFFVFIMVSCKIKSPNHQVLRESEKRVGLVGGRRSEGREGSTQSRFAEKEAVVTIVLCVCFGFFISVFCTFPFSLNRYLNIFNIHTYLHTCLSKCILYVNVCVYVCMLFVRSGPIGGEHAHKRVAL